MSASFDPAVGPILNVGVGQPASLRDAESKDKPIVRAYPALLDTGADLTCISASVAAEVGLVPTGKRTMSSATESRDMNTYLVDLVLPFGDPKAGGEMRGLLNATVMEFDAGKPEFQVLLGRDLLCLGLLSLVGYDKRLTFCM